MRLFDKPPLAKVSVGYLLKYLCSCWKSTLWLLGLVQFHQSRRHLCMPCAQRRLRGDFHLVDMKNNPSMQELYACYCKLILRAHAIHSAWLSFCRVSCIQNKLQHCEKARLAQINQPCHSQGLVRCKGFARILPRLRTLRQTRPRK